MYMLICMCEGICLFIGLTCLFPFFLYVLDVLDLLSGCLVLWRGGCLPCTKPLKSSIKT